MHCGTEEERQWFRALFTAEQLTRPLSTDEKRALLVRLTEVDGLERFLGRAFTGYKRFSIEGTDALVPMLDTAIEESVGRRRASHRDFDVAPRAHQRACPRHGQARSTTSSASSRVATIIWATSRPAT